MTRKQLESIIRFSSVFNDSSVDIAEVNEQFGLSLTEATGPSQAVTAYLEAKGIRLEGERYFKVNNDEWRLIKVTRHGENEQVAFIQAETHCMDLIAMENSNIDRNTFRANAQLISKAPEMLSTLQGLLTEANKLTDESGSIETFYQRFNQIEKLIKSATEVTNG